LTSARGGRGEDARVATAEALVMLWETVNATTTETIVNAAKRLVDELPPGASREEVGVHLMASAKRDDAARGVVWPEIDPAHLAAVGIDWHLFPNTIILPGITFALCYRARPNGYDPDSCIFEAYVLERFPEGQEPKTEWVYQPDASEARWRLVLSQDFQNMPEVQRGMKSRGFSGSRPNPVQEMPVNHFHRTLAEYMGTGAPQPLQNGISLEGPGGDARMSLEANKATAISFLNAFAAAGAIDLSRFTTDATWWTFGTGEIPVSHFSEVSGRTASAQFAGPGRFDVQRVTAEGDRVAIEATGFQPLKDGRSYDNTYLWVVTLRDDKICSVKSYYDTALAERTFQPRRG
jgi:ketosteroid isomerase-like protein